MDRQSGRGGGRGFFSTVGEGGDPTILYNITGYGLYSLFVEIQTEARFPINFKWEISEAWVKFWSQKKVWIFFQK